MTNSFNRLGSDSTGVLFHKRNPSSTSPRRAQFFTIRMTHTRRNHFVLIAKELHECWVQSCFCVLKVFLVQRQYPPSEISVFGQRRNEIAGMPMPLTLSPLIYIRMSQRNTGAIADELHDLFAMKKLIFKSYHQSRKICLEVFLIPVIPHMHQTVILHGKFRLVVSTYGIDAIRVDYIWTAILSTFVPTQIVRLFAL